MFCEPWSYSRPKTKSEEDEQLKEGKKCDSIVYILLPEVTWLSDAPHNNNKFKAIKQKFVKRNGKPWIRKNMGLFHDMYFKEYLILLPRFETDLKDYWRN